MKLANIKIKFSDIPVLCTIYIYNAPSLQTESNVSSRSAMIAMPYLFLVIASFIFSTSERIGCDAFLFFCSFREISYTVACLYYRVILFVLVSPSCSMSSVVIQSGPGAKFLLEIFITYLMLSSVKYVFWACLGVF